MIKMSYNIWTTPRETFCWLNATRAIVVSTDKLDLKSHCELVDTVSELS